MDCSQSLRDGAIGRAERQVPGGFRNDPDSDRHGIVTPVAGLMNPTLLAVAINTCLTIVRMAARRRRGQDAGQQQHDRPSRSQTRP